MPRNRNLPADPTTLRAILPTLVDVGNEQRRLAASIATASTAALRAGALALAEQLEQAHDETTLELSRTNTTIADARARIATAETRAAVSS